MAGGIIRVDLSKPGSLEKELADTTSISMVQRRVWNFVHRVTKTRISGCQYKAILQSNYFDHGPRVCLEDVRTLSSIHHKGKKVAGFMSFSLVNAHSRAVFETLDNALKKVLYPQVKEAVHRALVEEHDALRKKLGETKDESEKKKLQMKIEENGRQRDLLNEKCEWQSIIQKGEERKVPSSYGDTHYPDRVTASVPFAERFVSPSKGKNESSSRAVVCRTNPPESVIDTTGLTLPWTSVGNTTFHMVVVGVRSCVWTKYNRIRPELEVIRLVLPGAYDVGDNTKIEADVSACDGLSDEGDVSSESEVPLHKVKKKKKSLKKASKHRRGRKRKRLRVQDLSDSSSDSSSDSDYDED